MAGPQTLAMELPHVPAIPLPGTHSKDAPPAPPSPSPVLQHLRHLHAGQSPQVSPGCRRWGGGSRPGGLHARPGVLTRSSQEDIPPPPTPHPPPASGFLKQSWSSAALASASCGSDKARMGRGRDPPPPPSAPPGARAIGQRWLLSQDSPDSPSGARSGMNGDGSPSSLSEAALHLSPE